MFRFSFVLLFAATAAFAGPETRYENIPPGEAKLIEILTAKTKEAIALHRDAHAKAHGCIDGVKLTVKKDLPEALRIGVFAEPGRTFDAVLRMSNGAGEANVDDRKGGAHGMALKIFLEGDLAKKLRPLKGEIEFVHGSYYRTQDILGINRVPVFFVENVEDYLVFSAAKAAAGQLAVKLIREGKTPAEAKQAADELFKRSFILQEGKKPRLREAKVLGTLAAIKAIDPLEEDYHSMVPSLYGEAAVKYRMRPCHPVDLSTIVPPRGIDIGANPNYLRAVMKHHLKTSATCYVLSVLFHKEGMPSVEDAVADWGSDKYVDIATFTIPKKAEGKELMDEMLCERMAFTPWHTLPEHLPIGGIQRARESLYVEIANQRNKNIDGESNR